MKTLKTVMFINALTSGATALLLIAFPAFFASLFEVGQLWPFEAAGIFLLGFSLLVALEARRTAVRKNMLRFIIIMDVLWVVESIILVFPGLFGLSLIGCLLTAGVAAWVAMMAALQFRASKKAYASA